MFQDVTKADLADYLRRWQLVNAAEIEELRRTSPSEKFRQLAVLMASARALGWDEEDAEEVAAVRRRWSRLREVWRGRD